MVFVPHRGDLPARFGAGVPLIPDIGPAELDSSVYTDPARFEQERRKVLNRSWQIICRSEELAKPGDHVVWEGHGETIVVSRRRDGGVERVPQRVPAPRCAHRAAVRARRRVGSPAGGTAGATTSRAPLVGVPDREDFDEKQLAGALRPAGRVRRVGRLGLGRPGRPRRRRDADRLDRRRRSSATSAPTRMQDMELHDKLAWELDANWKVVIDGFNENYHAAHLHTISPQDVKDGRFSTYFTFGRNGMMVIPYKGVLAELQRDRRSPEPGDLPLHDLPDVGFQQQPGAPSAVPLGAARGRQDPLRGMGTLVQGRRRRVPGKDRRALGAAQGRRAGGCRDLPGVGGRAPIDARTPATSSTIANARSPTSTGSCRTCSTPRTDRSPNPPRTRRYTHGRSFVRSRDRLQPVGAKGRLRRDGSTGRALPEQVHRPGRRAVARAGAQLPRRRTCSAARSAPCIARRRCRSRCRARSPSRVRTRRSTSPARPVLITRDSQRRGARHDQRVPAPWRRTGERGHRQGKPADLSRTTHGATTWRAALPGSTAKTRSAGSTSRR